LDPVTVGISSVAVPELRLPTRVGIFKHITG